MDKVLVAKFKDYKSTISVRQQFLLEYSGSHLCLYILFQLDYSLQNVISFFILLPILTFFSFPLDNLFNMGINSRYGEQIPDTKRMEYRWYRLHYLSLPTTPLEILTFLNPEYLNFSIESISSSSSILLTMGFGRAQLIQFWEKHWI